MNAIFTNHRLTLGELNEDELLLLDSPVPRL
jgi:hypothetical protein